MVLSSGWIVASAPAGFPQGEQDPGGPALEPDQCKLAAGAGPTGGRAGRLGADARGAVTMGLDAAATDDWEGLVGSTALAGPVGLAAATGLEAVKALVAGTALVVRTAFVVTSALVAVGVLVAATVLELGTSLVVVRSFAGSPALAGPVGLAAATGLEVTDPGFWAEVPRPGFDADPELGARLWLDRAPCAGTAP